MINDMIFQLAVAHCIRVMPGDDLNNMDVLRNTTIQTYHQLLDIYNDLDKKLKADRKPGVVNIRTL